MSHTPSPPDASRFPRFPQPRFELGCLVATPGALSLLEEVKLTALSLIARHAGGDWGEVSPADALANEKATQAGLRILSSYRVGLPGKEGRKQVIWVITEADRSQTTLLLPEEY